MLKKFVERQKSRCLIALWSCLNTTYNQTCYTLHSSGSTIHKRLQWEWECMPSTNAMARLHCKLSRSLKKSCFHNLQLNATSNPVTLIKNDVKCHLKIQCDHTEITQMQIIQNMILYKELATCLTHDPWHFVIRLMATALLPMTMQSHSSPQSHYK